ncbi:MAG: peptidoglycan-binding protein [Patescibacteria group bacterium]|nr:peptidoglycan-binding protein [Patescibacteria group bacterium]
MFFKKKILAFLILIFMFGLTSSVYAVSDCGSPQTDKEGNTYYNCTCQGKRYDNCYVGLFISRPECACCGDCTLNDMVTIFINLADKILKFSGVFAILFLIVGGIVWMTSGGSQDKVKKGKDIVRGAIIGLVIILISFTIVKVIMQALGTERLLSNQTTQKETEWPACLVPPTKNKSWCYGCIWTGAGQGCRGEAVKIYQDELNQLGCNCGVADGKFGSDTKECTKRFQSANNLEVDGLVGPDTYKKIFESLDSKPCSP